MALVLVTGAGGFIGSHVVEAFLAAGRRVRALVRYSSSGRRGHLDESEAARAAERDGQLEVVFGDVTDPYRMLAAAEGADTIVHLAALIGIPYSYLAPAAYQAVNVGGALHLLEAARSQQVGRLVLTSTSEVYGSALYTPIDEAHPLQAQSPYAASKIGADKLAESYHRSFGLPVVILRPFNTYGPRQSLRAVVPTILAQCLAGSDPIRLGSLTPRRDLTFVTDTARALLLAATTAGIDGETIHVGSGEALSVAEVVARCRAVTGSSAGVVTDPDRVRPAASEVDCLLCAPAKARRLLGWEAKVPLEEGLERTAAYLRSAPGRLRPGSYAT